MLILEEKRHQRIGVKNERGEEKMKGVGKSLKEHFHLILNCLTN